MNVTELQLLQGIDTVIVRIADFENSRTWYLQKLGLKPLFEDSNMKLIVLDTGGPTSLTLWYTPQKISINREQASYPIFRTPDAAALRNELISRGIETGDIIKDEYVEYFFFYDPEGNVLEACQVHE